MATLRAYSIKRSATDVSVRFLTVMNPSGEGDARILACSALMRMCLPPMRMPEAGTRPSQRRVSIKRMQKGYAFRHVFEAVVRTCMDTGLVKGAGFAFNASVMEADASISCPRKRIVGAGAPDTCGRRVPGALT